MVIRSLILLGLIAALGSTGPAAAESDWTPAAQSMQASLLRDAPKTEKQSKKTAGKKQTRKEAAAAEKKKAEEKKLAARKKEKREPAAEIAAAPVELRSDTQEIGLFATLFGGQPRMLPETERRDAMLRGQKTGRAFAVKPEFQPQSVSFTGYPRGTIVIDTDAKFLYLVESSSSARRYAIAVGREGLLFTGKAKIQDKQEWPRWIPTKEMQEREPEKYAQYKDGMDGGPENPLGARALYLYQGKQDTHIRIHGTNQPWTIGTSSSNGCFRMVNEHVMDLYTRVKLGTDVIVL
jgi:lipoprotein-anchoring transpeptidase ErfK/SrfK